MSVWKHFDAWSLIVIALTLTFFLLALFIQGLTHDALLEAGVFLVSMKLIQMAYKNSVSNHAIQQKLNEIHAALGQPQPTQTHADVQQSSMRAGDERSVSDMSERSSD